MNNPLLPAIIAMVAVVGGVLIWNYVPQRQRRKRFEHRPELGMDEIYREFLAAKNLPKDIACELWKEVAELLRLPPGKLRPTDRFDNELAAPKGWEFDDDLVEVQWAAEHRLSQIGGSADLSQIKTLGDYVEFFCKLRSSAR